MGNRLSRQYDNMQEGVIKYDTAGKILYINKGCLDIFKYPEDKRPYCIFDLMEDSIVNSHKSRIKRKLASTENMINKNIRGVCYRGGFVKIDVTILPKKTLLIKEHYMEVKTMKQKLTFLNDIESMANAGYWEWEIGSDDLVCSDGLKSIYEIDDVTYEKYTELNHKNDRGFIRSTVETCIETQQNFVIRHRIITQKSNKLKWLEAKGRYIVNDGKKFITGVVRDITQEYETEQGYIKDKEFAENSSRTKSSFVASVSHEIRTPLNGIVGMVSLLETTSLTEKQKEYISVLDNSCGMLMSIINNILDFSKIESGNMKPDYSSFDIKHLVTSTCAAFIPQCEKKHISFSLKQYYTNDTVTSDSVKISQIISNILSNSIKFTSKGEISVNVSSNYGRIDIIIQDTGVGIKEEFLAQISSPFTQADDSTTRIYGGSGLGLSIVKSYVDMLDGDLVLESEVGVGTKTSISLPIKSSKKSNTIVVVEDNPANQYIMKEIFSAIGDLDIVFFDNGKLALDGISTDPGIIFMDLHMPVMDGHEATILLRKKGICCPIVALTANSMRRENIRCLESGMDGYLIKPVDIGIIKNKLEKYSII